MIEKLNRKLLEEGFDTQLDNDGVYIPKYNIDIISENTSFIIQPSDSDPVVLNSLDDTIIYIKDLSYSLDFSEEMDKNNFLYQKESPRFFSIGNNRINIVDGRFFLKDENGETNIYVNIPSVISAIQSKFLGEK
ncbi:hypothetical protein QWY52_13455 [Staphylococcus aureus]|uniref:hypothetical protein n=1 Tax=Staphylococcus TaxID=1279 RepID=UPI000452B37B|nr:MULTISPECIES: hypothetical protein [Staphylococcus]EGQ3127604.1 hypothetical protein [Staphylococcus pseudintermedius]EZZ41284.1 hypothetical protein V111_02631 [Staphylococcus aureus Tur-20]MCE4962604.1 hypothetical protein [Staphylococcus chromogenes]MCE6047467.1 hypothetical protein [Staphylococcus aureus]MDG6600817.1 hypothetical protein [Staphylococcus aureus]